MIHTCFKNKVSNTLVQEVLQLTLTSVLPMKEDHKNNISAGITKILHTMKAA